MTCTFGRGRFGDLRRRTGVEFGIENPHRIGMGVVGALGDVPVVVVIAAAREVAGRVVRGAEEAVVAELFAVAEQEHQQPVVVDGAQADHLAALEHLLLDAVHRPVDRDVGELGEPGGARGIPGVGERRRAPVGAERVRRADRHAGDPAGARDAAAVLERVDEHALALRGPAVVALAKDGGGEGGRFGFHFRFYGKIGSCRKVISPILHAAGVLAGRRRGARRRPGRARSRRRALRLPLKVSAGFTVSTGSARRRLAKPT